MKMTFAESFGIVQTQLTPAKGVLILRFLLPNFHTISREQKPCREIIVQDLV